MVKIGYIPSNRANYGGARALSKIEYIVLHYTSNDGDHDTNNANYFKSNVVKASANYFVDDDSITMSVPDNYIAYSVGGAKWSDCSKTGGGTMYGKITNTNSISIEMCDTVRDGKHNVSTATLNNTIDLVVSLLIKYNLKPSAVYRHFDVNGKHCPAYAMDQKVWNSYLNKIKAAYNAATNKKENTKKETKKEETKAEPKKEQATSTTTTKKTKYAFKTFVKDVQKALGVDDDGVVGKVTFGATVTLSMSTNRKHKVVKYIQKYLNSLGYDCGDTDGDFGPKTDNAVKLYQKEVVKLNKPDGEITASGATWRKLLKYAG